MPRMSRKYRCHSIEAKLGTSYLVPLSGQHAEVVRTALIRGPRLLMLATTMASFISIVYLAEFTSLLD
jgi:hypothetical protein